MKTDFQSAECAQYAEMKPLRLSGWSNRAPALANLPGTGLKRSVSLNRFRTNTVMSVQLGVLANLFTLTLSVCQAQTGLPARVPDLHYPPLARVNAPSDGYDD